MVVQTQHEDAARLRKAVLDLTLSMLTPSSDRNGFDQVGVAAARHGLERPTWQPHHRFETDASKSFFVLDREACILCGRCTTACAEIQHIGAISLLGRNHDARVGVIGDGPMSASICTSCGQCVATCPTGALRPKEAGVPVIRRVETTCPYCGVGCGITLSVRKDGRLAGMADDAPANASSRGMLCVKGRFGTGFVHARDRITSPMIKRDGVWHEVSWDEALDAAADGLARHVGHFGTLASAKATNEDGYVIQKLARHVMGTNNVDHCTRLCHSPSVEAMLVSMGSGATSNSYEDYEEAGCLMVVGADASANHPVIAVRFRRAVARGARLIVVNPKRVELCDQADLWIQERPGTDVALFNAMAKVLLDEGLADLDWIRARTENFEAWAAALAPYTSSTRRRSRGCGPRTSRRPRAGTRSLRSRAPASSGAWASPSTSTAPPTRTRCSTSRWPRARWGSRPPASRRCAARTTCRAAATPGASPPTCRAMPTTPTGASTASRQCGAVGRPPSPGSSSPRWWRAAWTDASAPCTSWGRTRSCPSPISITPRRR
jgi:predicted molibdopterin-dependent oxidoreductase YjgC